MKRSSSVRLTLMGAAAATGLSACGGDTPPAPSMFATVEQCVTGGFDRARCQGAFDQAAKSHEDAAPKFPTREECLRAVDVENCAPREVRNPDGTTTSVFVPALAGFLIGQALARQPSGYGGGSYGGGYYGPAYRSRDYPGQFRDAGNMVGSRSGSTGVATTSPSTPTVSRPPNVNTTTIARGGFGSSGSSFGSSSA